MSLHSFSLAGWVILAVVVFWVLGAYNRLVVLRAQMQQSLSMLLSQWHGAAQILRDNLPEDLASVGLASQWGHSKIEDQSWQPVVLAAKQLQTCLAPVRDAAQSKVSLEYLASLAAARKLLRDTWYDLNALQDDLAGAVVPHNLVVLWQHQSSLADEKLVTYNLHAETYNAAVVQFPAFIVAWVFGFQRTRAL